jgi:hypothetical protein
MNKNRVFGPVMIPDKEIYRNANHLVNEPHNVVFPAATIAGFRERFHENNFDNNVNINHDGIQVTGVKLSKSFLIDQENKNSLPEEFKDLPIGTWMAEYEIENEEIWQLIQNKKLRGFSIEAILAYGYGK